MARISQPRPPAPGSGLTAVSMVMSVFKDSPRCSPMTRTLHCSRRKRCVSSPPWNETWSAHGPLRVRTRSTWSYLATISSLSLARREYKSMRESERRRRSTSALSTRVRHAVSGHSAAEGQTARLQARLSGGPARSFVLSADAVNAASHASRRSKLTSRNGRALTQPHTARGNARRAMYGSSDDEIEILAAPDHRARPSAAPPSSDAFDNSPNWKSFGRTNGDTDGHMTASQQLLLLSDDSADEGDDLLPAPFRANSQQRPRDVRSASTTRRVFLSYPYPPPVYKEC